MRPEIKNNIKLLAKHNAIIYNKNVKNKNKEEIRGGTKVKKLKNTNKGITLIALIITIIVMLILVGVTISMAVNGGLFEKAGEAVGDTQNAINAEQQLANGEINVGGVLYDSIDDYVKGIPSTGVKIKLSISVHWI